MNPFKLFLVLGGLGWILGVGVLLADAELTDANKVQHISQSYVAESQGKLEEATEAVLELYRNDAKDYFTHLRLGWLFYLRRMYSNSMNHYKKALAEKPQALEPHLGLLNVGVAENRWAEVEKQAMEGLKKFPGELKLTQMLIRAQVEQKNWGRAWTSIDGALDIFPIDPVLLEFRVRVARELGKTELAKGARERLQMIYPGVGGTLGKGI